MNSGLEKILKFKTSSDILRHLSKPVYLHFFDRDLINTVSSFNYVKKDELLYNLKLSLLSSNETFLISTAVLFENRMLTEIFSDIRDLCINRLIKLSIKEQDLSSFINNKKQMFEHDKANYEFYFNDTWKKIESLIFTYKDKNFDTSTELNSDLLTTFVTGGNLNLNKNLNLEINPDLIYSLNPFLIEAIKLREKKAITGRLFQPYFEKLKTDLKLQFISNLQIEVSYINVYLKNYNSTIFTNPLFIDLKIVNFLSDSYPFLDLSLWDRIYSKLGAINFLKKLDSKQIIEIRNDSNYIQFIDSIRLLIFKIIKGYSLNETGDKLPNTLLSQIVSRVTSCLYPYDFQLGDVEEFVLCFKTQREKILEENKDAGLVFIKKESYIMKKILFKDIGIIIALGEEFAVLIEHFPNYNVIRDDESGNFYYEFEEFGYKIVAFFISEMGSTSAAISTISFLAKYQVKTIVNMGIAGSLDSDFRLGDVIVANSVDGYFENAKAINSTETGFSFEFSGDVLKTSEEFIKIVDNLPFASKVLYKDLEEKSKKFLTSNFDDITLKDFEDFHLISEEVKLTKGKIASGTILNTSDNFSNFLKRHRDRKYKCIEMESYGILLSLSNKKFNSLVIRGISDFADDRKSKLDTNYKGKLRTLAMFNCINLFKVYLELKAFE